MSWTDRDRFDPADARPDPCPKADASCTGGRKRNVCCDGWGGNCGDDGCSLCHRNGRDHSDCRRSEQEEQEQAE